MDCLIAEDEGCAACEADDPDAPVPSSREKLSKGGTTGTDWLCLNKSERINLPQVVILGVVLKHST